MKIAEWKDTKWLVLSSYFFSIPGAVAYYHNCYLLSGVLITTSLISANHWRNPLLNSWRRKIDIGVSNVSLCIMSIHNHLYVKLHHQYITYSLFILLCYCFYQSYFMYKYNMTTWRNYHFLFHVVCSCNAGIIVYNRIEY